MVFRETSDSSLIQRAAADIRSHFAAFSDFQPRTLFIATWEKVGYFKQNSDRVCCRIITCDRYYSEQQIQKCLGIYSRRNADMERSFSILVTEVLITILCDITLYGDFDNITQ